MSLGLVRGGRRGRGLRLNEQAAALIGVALLAVVVVTILITFVLLLVRRSPTPSAVGSVRPLAHLGGGGVGSQPLIRNRATG